jgi:hypothetical protein
VSYYDAVSSMSTLSLTACYLVMGKKFVGAAGHEVLQGSVAGRVVKAAAGFRTRYLRIAGKMRPL